MASEQLRTPPQDQATPVDAAQIDQIERALTDLAAYCDAMPPVRAMGVRPLAYDGIALTMGAPLPANVNDKGCAFGGSLGGLMTLAAWGWISVNLRLAGLDDADIYVADSEVRYLLPLFADLVATATPADGETWNELLAVYRQRGKMRISMQARALTPDGESAATFSGRFVVKRRQA